MLFFSLAESEGILVVFIFIYGFKVFLAIKMSGVNKSVRNMD